MLVSRKGAIVLVDEPPIPLRIPFVEYRHNVHVESRSSKGNRDTVGLGHYLVRAEVRERFAEALSQIVEELCHIVRSVSTADVTGQVDIVQGAQCRPLRNAARE